MKVAGSPDAHAAAPRGRRARLRAPVIAAQFEAWLIGMMPGGAIGIGRALAAAEMTGAHQMRECRLAAGSRGASA